MFAGKNYKKLTFSHGDEFETSVRKRERKIKFSKVQRGKDKVIKRINEIPPSIRRMNLSDEEEERWKAKC